MWTRNIFAEDLVKILCLYFSEVDNNFTIHELKRVPHSAFTRFSVQSQGFNINSINFNSEVPKYFTPIYDHFYTWGCGFALTCVAF